MESLDTSRHVGGHCRLRAPSSPSRPTLNIAAAARAAVDRRVCVGDRRAASHPEGASRRRQDRTARRRAALLGTAHRGTAIRRVARERHSPLAVTQHRAIAARVRVTRGDCRPRRRAAVHRRPRFASGHRPADHRRASTASRGRSMPSGRGSASASGCGWDSRSAYPYYYDYPYAYPYGPFRTRARIRTPMRGRCTAIPRPATRRRAIPRPAIRRRAIRRRAIRRRAIRRRAIRRRLSGVRLSGVRLSGWDVSDAVRSAAGLPAVRID